MLASSRRSRAPAAMMRSRVAAAAEARAELT